jgi:pimeloyl-ACP methyl ester carboxylesterase
VSRKGFRFVGEVREGTAPAAAGEAAAGAASSPAPQPQIPKAAREQRISYCRTADGVNLAVARVGRGLPVICPPVLGTHMELDWQNPTRAELWQFLAERFELIRYDGGGWGLSDRLVPEISPAVSVRELETVIDALGVSRYALFVSSDGIVSAIVHAARHPERVARIVIQGSSAQGANKLGLSDLVRFMNAIASMFAGSVTRDWSKLELVLLCTMLVEAFPGLSSEQIDWCVEQTPKTTSLQYALKHISAFADYDIVDLLPEVVAPTLVLHSRHCRILPLELGHRIAASMPNARLVPCDTANLVPLPGEPAWPAFLGAIETFLSQS